MSTHLPTELWRKILRHATHVPLLLDTELIYDPNRRLWAGFSTPGKRPAYSAKAFIASNAIKRAIVLVCHSWRDMGVEFLYENINLSPVAKTGLLLEVMKQSASASYVGHGWWTKRIMCAGDSRATSENSITSLLELCHNLQIFVVDCMVLPNAAQCRLAAKLQSRFSHSLRRFELLIGTPDDDPPIAVFEPVPNLRLSSLSITIGAHVLDDPPHPCFDTVETLCIFVPKPLFNTLPTQWNFPNLRNLALYYLDDRDIPELLSFIDRHRHNICCLTIHPSELHCDFVSLISRASSVQSLTFTFGHLQRLARFIKRTGEVPELCGITHLGVIHSDWRSYIPLFDDDLKIILARGSFPHLKVLRLVDMVRPKDMPSWEDLGMFLLRCGIRLEDEEGKPLLKPT